MRPLYLLGLAVLFGIGLLNFLVDPYLFFDSPRIEGVNRWKTAFFWKQLDAKAHLVQGSGTTTLIVGTSSVGGSLDPEHPALGNGRAFNFGIAGSSPRVQRIAFAHAARSNPLETLIVGVDFFAYNAYADNAILDARAERLSPSGPAGERWLRWRRSLELGLVKLFAYRTLEDSIATVRSQDAAFVQGAHWDMRSNGLWTTPRDATRTQLEAFAAIERQYLTAGWFPDPARRYALARDGRQPALEELRGLLADARAAGVTVTLAIMPFHARFAEAMNAAGLWETFEELKRQIVLLAGEPELAGSRIRVWDFSGYNSVSTVPVNGAQAENRWFHDSIHPTAATGDLMLWRMFAPAEAARRVPPDFGIELAADRLEAQLGEVRAARARYLQGDGADVEDVRRLAAQTRSWRDTANRPAR